MTISISDPKVDHEALTKLVDDVDVILWQSGPEGNPFTYVNEAAERLLGHPAERWLERDFWANQIVHPEDRARTMAACSRATAQGADHALEYRAIAADGGIVWLRDLVRLVLGPDGSLAGLHGVLIDITAYKDAANP